MIEVTYTQFARFLYILQRKYDLTSRYSNRLYFELILFQNINAKKIIIVAAN